MLQFQSYWMVFHSCSHFGWYLEFEFATACFLWHPRLESDYTWAALKEYSVNLYSQGTLDWHLSPWKLWIMYVLCAHLEESLLSLPSPMCSCACAELVLQTSAKYCRCCKLHRNVPVTGSKSSGRSLVCFMQNASLCSKYVLSKMLLSIPIG